MVHGMADLLDRDGALGKGRLLSVVAFKLDAVLLVDDGVGGDWRVVASINS